MVNGGVWWCMVVCGGEWWCIVMQGGVWWCMVVQGGVWWWSAWYVGWCWQESLLILIDEAASYKTRYYYISNRGEELIT